MNNGLETRMARLFNRHGDGRAVCVAADHGYMSDVTPNVVKLRPISEAIIRSGVDGILMSPGQAIRLAPLFQGRAGPALIVRADWMNMPRLGSSNVTNAVPQRHLFHQKVLSAEQALELGATAITIYLFLGYDDNVEAAGIASCAQFAQECRRVGLPCIMEPLAVGGHVTGANVVDILTLGARICVELGADALKIPYTGDVDSFTRLVQVSQVPVLVLGGARSDNERDALELFAEGLEAGCHGCLMGRNVTKSPNPEQLTRQLGMVAHQGYSVDEALRGQKWDHLRLKAAPARCTGCNLCVTACVAAHGKLTFGTHLPRLHIDPVALGQHKVMFCTLCKKCIDICPTNALRWHADTAAVELLPEACTACEKCVDVCPTRVVMKGPAPAGSSLPWVPVICDLCGADPLQGPQNRDPLRSGGFPQNRDAKRNAKRDAKGYPACVKICPTAAIYSDERIKVS